MASDRFARRVRQAWKQLAPALLTIQLRTIDHKPPHLANEASGARGGVRLASRSALPTNDPTLDRAQTSTPSFSLIKPYHAYFSLPATFAGSHSRPFIYQQRTQRGLLVNPAGNCAAVGKDPDSQNLPRPLNAVPTTQQGKADHKADLLKLSSYMESGQLIRSGKWPTVNLTKKQPCIEPDHHMLQV